MKNKSVLIFDGNHVFDSITRLQLDGIQSFLFPKLFLSGIHDNKDIVAENIETIDGTGTYLLDQIDRFRTIASLLNNGSEQSQKIVEAFVISVKNTRVLADEDYYDDYLEPTVALTKERSERVLKKIKDKIK